MSRVIFIFLAFVTANAWADLYRWVDPQSGSVKFSSTPPPWYDTDQGPKVERIPAPRPPPVAAKAAPAPAVAGPGAVPPKPEPPKP